MNLEQQRDCESVWNQMRSRYPEFLAEYDPTNNWHAVREIILGGSLSWAQAHTFFQPFPGARILDLGANVGLYSIFCATQGAIVTAYEPDSASFSILSGVINQFSLPVTVHNQAVWSSEGTLPFRAQAHTNGRTQYNGAVLTPGEVHQYDDKTTVPCVSFDDVIGDQEWDFVKMDIEGAEFEVLNAASSDTLCKIKSAYIEFHPWIDIELYVDTIIQLQEFFHFDGIWSNELNRWESACLKRKY